MEKRSLSVLLVLALFSFNVITVFAEEALFYKVEQPIQIGMSGKLVSSLQKYLASIGVLSKDKITGYFGQLTKKAIKIVKTKPEISLAGVKLNLLLFIGLIKESNILGGFFLSENSRL